MTLTNSTDQDIAELARAMKQPEPYRDPLASERANPHKWVDGYSIVDSTHKSR